MKKNATKTVTIMIWRQGDVGLQLVDTPPRGAKAKPRGGLIVLAYGEVTGHAHAIHETCVEESEMTDGTIYITATGEFNVRHEEHGTITLAPGTYRVRRQREYTPEAIRTVAD